MSGKCKDYDYAKGKRTNCDFIYRKLYFMKYMLTMAGFERERESYVSILHEQSFGLYTWK